MKLFEVSSRKVLSNSEYLILRENDRIYELSFKINANGRMLVLAEESLMVEIGSKIRIIGMCTQCDPYK